MNYSELAQVVSKKPTSVAMFFSRHKLSVKSPEDVRFYLNYIQRGKRIESGKRSMRHLNQYRFKPNPQKLERARDLVRARKLIWYANPQKLSENAVVEQILSQGDFNDFLELIRIFGRQHVRRIFAQQADKPRNNYHPSTLNFYKHYFSI